MAEHSYRQKKILLIFSFLVLVLGTVTLTGVVRPVHATVIVVALDYQPSSPVINQTVTLAANWTGGSAPYMFSLSFGDGSPNATGTISSITNTGLFSADHNYTLAGPFTVAFSVKDSTGSSGNKAITVRVRGSLVTNLSSSSSTAYLGDTVQFTGAVRNGTRNLQGTYNFTFEWNYGDGYTNVTRVVTSTDPSISATTSTTTHQMRATGSLTTILHVLDNLGQGGFSSKTITIGGLLGIDCGYGSLEAVNNGTGYPNPDGALNTGNAGIATLDRNCSWAGGPDIAGGGTYLTPLVSDSPTSIGSSCCEFQGGGFTGDIVYIERGPYTGVTGFDVTVSWNPNILYAVEFDQSGLTFNGGDSFTAFSAINNTAGTAELSQALFGRAASDNVTLFRIRFDVVGVGTTGLTISNDLIIDSILVPNTLPHKTVQGSFTSANIPDLLAAATLGYMVNWTYSPNPEITGAPLTLTAKASCSGCTGTLTYKWDTDSVQGYPDSSKPPATIEASGSTATITAPTATLMAHRITLIVNDTAGHVAEATRRLPLSLPVVSAMGAFTVGSPQQLQAKWLGGIPPYTGTSGQVGVKWTLCNPTSPANVICSNAIPSTTTTSSQNNNVTVAYHFAGVYTGSVIVTDTGLLWIPSSPTSTPKVNFRMNVTGTPRAFTVVVVSNSTSGASGGRTVTLGATISYDSTYPGSAQSSRFNYTIMFGDGSSTQLSARIGPLSISHTYGSFGTYSVTVLAQESSANSLAKLIEVGRVTVVVTPPLPPTTTSLECTPSSTFVGIPTECTVNVTDTSSNPTPPTGTVTFASVCQGACAVPAPCDLAGTSSVTSCSITYTPLTIGSQTIFAVYKGDADHSGSSSSFTVSVSPAPPVINVSPSGGSIGTKVIVHGQNFTVTPVPGVPPSPATVLVTFDDQTVGTAAIQRDGSFVFVFDVPEAQAGLHQIHAYSQLFSSVVGASANFTVLAEQGRMTVNISTGTLYFPGETAVIYARVALNGNLTQPEIFNLTIISPNGTSIVLSLKNLGTGFYRAQYPVPTTAQLGTYLLIGKGNLNGLSSIGSSSFEVKLSWLSSHGTQLGLLAIGLSGVAILGVAWNIGYLQRRRIGDRSGPKRPAPMSHDAVIYTKKRPSTLSGYWLD